MKRFYSENEKNVIVTSIEIPFKDLEEKVSPIPVDEIIIDWSNVIVKYVQKTINILISQVVLANAENRIVRSDKLGVAFERSSKKGVVCVLNEEMSMRETIVDLIQRGHCSGGFSHKAAMLILESLAWISEEDRDDKDHRFRYSDLIKVLTKL